MNNIARIIGSVVLLGACAVGMRFTMQTVDIPHTKGKLHTARVDTSKAKKIELQVYLPTAQRFDAQVGVAGRMAGTFRASEAFSLRLRDTTESTRPKKENLTRIGYETGLSTYTNFLTNRPDTYGAAELRLPRDVPIEMYIDPQEVEVASFDLQGADIRDFNLPSDRHRANIDMKMPLGSAKAQFYIRNDTRLTRVGFSLPSQGTMQIYSDRGAVVIDTYAKIPMQISIVGNAPSAAAFRERVLKNSYLDFVWDEAKPHMFPEFGYYLIGNSKTTSKTPFKLFIQLGEQARVRL
jgi:hypothetical protein